MVDSSQRELFNSSICVIEVISYPISSSRKKPIRWQALKFKTNLKPLLFRESDRPFLGDPSLPDEGKLLIQIEH